MRPSYVEQIVRPDAGLLSLHKFVMPCEAFGMRRTHALTLGLF
jgi:hypothetical protein